MGKDLNGNCPGLTQYGASLEKQRVAVLGKVGNLLRNDRIKLQSILSGVLSQSGRHVRVVIGDGDIEQLKSLAKGESGGEYSRLWPELEARVLPHHRFLLKQLGEQHEFLRSKIVEVEQEMKRRMALPRVVRSPWQRGPRVRLLACGSCGGGGSRCLVSVARNGGARVDRVNQRTEGERNGAIGAEANDPCE